jgi:hypothetical protein
MTREPAGKLYRKAFITLHRADFPSEPKNLTEAQAKAWLKRAKPHGRGFLLAVDAIRSVRPQERDLGIYVHTKTRGGEPISVRVHGPKFLGSTVERVGGGYDAVAETVEEVEALIRTALTAAAQ